MAILNHSISLQSRTPYREKQVVRLRNLARKLYDWRWHRVSLACYHLLVRLEPDNDNTWHDRGVIFTELGRYDKAVADFRQALAIYPHHHLAYYNLGQVLWSQDKYAEAITHYQRAIELHPARGLYWYGLALAQQSAGKTPDALESVQKAIALGADGEEVSIEEFKAFYQALK